MDDFLKFFIPIFVVSCFLAIIFTLFDSGIDSKKEAIQNYNECKEKTVDIEWCFNIFRPTLENNLKN